MTCSAADGGTDASGPTDATAEGAADGDAVPVDAPTGD
jgi:hypothetical protein